MQNRRRNLYWSLETDKAAADLAWKNKLSVSQFVASLVMKAAEKLKLTASK